MSSEPAACAVCGRSPEWHKRFDVTPDALEIAEEHAMMAAALMRHKIQQAQAQLEVEEKRLKDIRILRDSQRARGLHQLQELARARGILVEYQVGTHAITSALLYGGPSVAIHCPSSDWLRFPRLVTSADDVVSSKVAVEYYEALPAQLDQKNVFVYRA